MQFTPQQLSGAGKYSPKVLIGNWNEDAALQEVKEKANRYKKSLSNRQSDLIVQRTAAGSKPAILSKSQDGYLRFGYTINLKHAASEYNLACNLDEELDSVLPGVVENQVSGCEKVSLRTSFMLLQPPNSPAKEFIEYGDEIVLATHPLLRVDPNSGLCQNQFYLMSSQNFVNGSTSAAQEQEVRVAKVIQKSSVRYIRWRVEPIHLKKWKLDDDKRVKCFEKIQLVHCATGKALSMDKKFVLYNDYGQELDVFCCLHQKNNKIHYLNKESHGIFTTEQRLSVQSKNWWIMETNGNQQQEEEGKCHQEDDLLYITVDTVLDLVAHQTIDRLEVVRDYLKQEDQANSGVIERIAFKWALIDSGIVLSDDEFDCMLDHFETKSGGIEIEAFIGNVQDRLI